MWAKNAGIIYPHKKSALKFVTLTHSFILLIIRLKVDFASGIYRVFAIIAPQRIR